MTRDALLELIRKSGCRTRDSFVAWCRETGAPANTKSVARLCGTWAEALESAHGAQYREAHEPGRERAAPAAPRIAPDPWGRDAQPDAPQEPASMKERVPSGETLLIIPDAHAHPEHDNARFDALGKWVAREKPDYVVCLGDWWDLPSINSHASARDKEGHRVRADLESGWDAMRRFVAPWWESSYAPKRAVFCMGNHEARIESLASLHPEWEGAVPDSAYMTRGLESFGWEVHGFKSIVDVCGYAVSHFLPSGVMGRAVSGVNQARSLIMHGRESAIVGHSHVYGHHIDTSYLDRRLQGIVAGCYVHPRMVEGWNRQTAGLWARGVVKVTLLAPGYGDVEFVSAERMA